MILARCGGRPPAWLPLCAALFLGGCGLLPWQRPDESGTERTFELLGRVSVRHEARLLTGTLRWQHARARDEVWFSTPLGETIAHIAREPLGATLTTASREVYRAASVASLTRDGLGWAFPLADLGYYVFGEVPPGRLPELIERAADGRIERVVAGGWDVELREGDIGRPQRLRLRGPEAEIRLVVDRLTLD